jgi:hypothetical protein
MRWLGVGVSGVFLGDSTKFKFLKLQISNLAVSGYKKLPRKRLSVSCKNKTAGDPLNRTRLALDLESSRRELSADEQLGGGI